MLELMQRLYRQVRVTARAFARRLLQLIKRLRRYLQGEKIADPLPAIKDLFEAGYVAIFRLGAATQATILKIGEIIKQLIEYAEALATQYSERAIIGIINLTREERDDEKYVVWVTGILVSETVSQAFESTGATYEARYKRFSRFARARNPRAHSGNEGKVKRRNQLWTFEDGYKAPAPRHHTLPSSITFLCHHFNLSGNDRKELLRYRDALY